MASRHATLQALPWLIFFSGEGDDEKTKHLYCPENSEVFRFPLPSQVVDKIFLGSYDGGWAAATASPYGALVIVNLFSGAEVALSEEQRRVFSHNVRCAIRKIIFSKSPTSSGCILAAIIEPQGVALCGVGCPVGGWTAQQYSGATFADIIFYNEELYGLTTLYELVKFEIGSSEDRVPIFTITSHKLSVKKNFHYRALVSYIVELHGKIALAVETRWSVYHKPFFKVFELADEATTLNGYKWVEMTSLGDYALFLDQTWSKAVYVPESGRDGVQRNHIYDGDMVYLWSLDNRVGRKYLRQDENVGDEIKLVGSYIDGGP